MKLGWHCVVLGWASFRREIGSSVSRLRERLSAMCLSSSHANVDALSDTYIYI